MNKALEEITGGEEVTAFIARRTDESVRLLREIRDVLRRAPAPTAISIDDSGVDPAVRRAAARAAVFGLSRPAQIDDSYIGKPLSLFGRLRRALLTT